jgi:hypothetical protein
LTGKIFPLKPPAIILLRINWPHFPNVEEAPMTATDLGLKTASRLEGELSVFISYLPTI